MILKDGSATLWDATPKLDDPRKEPTWTEKLSRFFKSFWKSSDIDLPEEFNLIGADDKTKDSPHAPKTPKDPPVKKFTSGTGMRNPKAPEELLKELKISEHTNEQRKFWAQRLAQSRADLINTETYKSLSESDRKQIFAPLIKSTMDLEAVLKGEITENEFIERFKNHYPTLNSDPENVLGAKESLEKLHQKQIQIIESLDKELAAGRAKKYNDLQNADIRQAHKHSLDILPMAADSIEASCQDAF